MKKLFLILVIVFTNGLFTSCTDLEDNEQEINSTELQNTGGEDEQLPEEDDEVD